MKNNPVKAYIALGSNMGDREQNLNRGVEMLRCSENVEVTAVSSYVNTAPVGYTEQPDFLNAVVEVRTILTPRALLEACIRIEKSMKRERIIRWGPRIIDLDIVLYGDLILDEEQLTIPHPRMHEREFVLGPLNEIAPQILHPVFKQCVHDLYRALLK